MAKDTSKPKQKRIKGVKAPKTATNQLATVDNKLQQFTFSVDKVLKLASFGLTDAEICAIVGIVERTFEYYKTHNPEFTERLRLAKAEPDAKVIESLYRLALGYEVQEKTETRDDSGHIIETKVTTKQIAPSASAVIFWLKNRRGKDWRDKHEIEQNITETKQVVIVENRIDAIKDLPAEYEVLKD